MPQELYPQNLDFTGIIRPGDHIVWGQGSGEPQTLVERLVEQRHRIGPASVFLGGISYTTTLKPEHADMLTFSGYGAVGHLRELARAGALRTIPCHLSQLVPYFNDGIIRSDVVFVQTSPPNERGAPVLMLTTFSNPSVRKLALRSGASDYLLKFFSVDEISERIRQALLNAGSRECVAAGVEEDRFRDGTASEALSDWPERRAPIAGVERHRNDDISRAYAEQGRPTVRWRSASLGLARGVRYLRTLMGAVF